MSALINLKKVLCPWCRESIAGSTDLKACATCSSIMHNTCYAELGGGHCATCLIEKLGTSKINSGGIGRFFLKLVSIVSLLIGFIVLCGTMLTILCGIGIACKWLIVSQTIFSHWFTQFVVGLISVAATCISVVFINDHYRQNIEGMFRPFYVAWVRGWNRILNNPTGH